MTRWGGHGAALTAVFGLVLLTCAACSRSSSDAGPVASSGSTATPPLVASVSEPSASAVGPGPVLTPEDVEPDAERRITEQNLESELDRLEREIQGE